MCAKKKLKKELMAADGAGVTGDPRSGQLFDVDEGTRPTAGVSVPIHNCRLALLIRSIGKEKGEEGKKRVREKKDGHRAFKSFKKVHSLSTFYLHYVRLSLFTSYLYYVYFKRRAVQKLYIC